MSGSSVGMGNDLARRYSSRSWRARRRKNIFPFPCREFAVSAVLISRKHPQKDVKPDRRIEYPTLGWSSSPSTLRLPAANAGSAAPAEHAEASLRCLPTTRGQLASRCEQEESMKVDLSFLLAAALVCTAAPASF